MIGKPWLALTAVCWAVGLNGLAGSAAADCPPGAPTGLFQGSATKADGERIDVTLNLVCAEGRYAAQVFTSQSDFTASDATGDSGHVALTFGAQGRGDLKAEGEALTGSLSAGAGGMTASLRRAGPALAMDALRPTLDLTPDQWREDLKAFADGLTHRHANAFFHTPRPAFEAQVARLDRRLGQLNSDEVFAGLQRLASAVGDGHTGVVFPPDSQRLPIQIVRFGPEGRGELRIVSAGAGLERALGARIERIGALSADEAFRRSLAITPQDELPALREGIAASNLTRGLVLHGLGITPQRTHAVFTLRDDAGRTFKLDIPAMAPGAPLNFKRAATASTLAQQNPGKSFWCQDLPESHALYCAFNAYSDLGRGSLEMFGQIDKAHPAKLIVDMRNNGGGDNTLGYAFLVKPLIARADLNQKGRLYVLVGALTFSAAMNNAAQFQDQTRAILVGQQIGEKPNSYQEPRQFRLPNSHLIVRASSKYYKFREHGPNAVTPDKTITPTWAEVKSGRDPVLEWVLAQPTP